MCNHWIYCDFVGTSETVLLVELSAKLILMLYCLILHKVKLHFYQSFKAEAYARKLLPLSVKLCGLNKCIGKTEQNKREKCAVMALLCTLYLHGLFDGRIKHAPLSLLAFRFTCKIKDEDFLTVNKRFYIPTAFLNILSVHFWNFFYYFFLHWNYTGSQPCLCSLRKWWWSFNKLKSRIL